MPKENKRMRFYAFAGLTIFILSTEKSTEKTEKGTRRKGDGETKRGRESFSRSLHGFALSQKRRPSPLSHPLEAYGNARRLP